MQGDLSFTVDLDLGAVADRMLAAIPGAVHAGLEHIAEISDGNTPMETGALLASRKVTPEAEIVDVGFLGYYIWYAIYVHEILRNHHPHGTAKWLELAVLAGSEMAKKIAAHRIGEALG